MAEEIATLPVTCGATAKYGGTATLQPLYSQPACRSAVIRILPYFLHLGAFELNLSLFHTAFTNGHASCNTHRPQQHFLFEGVELMENFRNILVISRMIPYSLKAIKVGISLARKYDAKLLVLHLVSNPVDMMAVNTPGQLPGEQYRIYMNSHQEAEERLDKFIKKEIRGGFPIKELVSDGNPIAEIVKVVEEEKIDLILVSAHEEGRLEHALFGGENDALIRKMPCSVLLVKK